MDLKELADRAGIREIRFKKDAGGFPWNSKPMYEKAARRALDDARRLKIGEKYNGWSCIISFSKDGAVTVTTINGNSKLIEQMINPSDFIQAAFTREVKLRGEICAMLREDGVWKSLGHVAVSSMAAFKRWCKDQGVEEENLTMHFYVFEILEFGGKNCGQIDDESMLREKLIRALIKDDATTVKPAEYTMHTVNEKEIILNGTACRLDELTHKLHDEARVKLMEGYIVQVIESSDPPNPKIRCVSKENEYPRLSDRFKVKEMFTFTLAVFKYRNREGDPRFILAGRETYFDLRVVSTLDPQRCSREVMAVLHGMPFTTGRTMEDAGLDYQTHSKTVVQVECAWISFREERLEGVKYIHTCRKDVSKTDISFVQPEDDPYWSELKRRNIIAKRLMEAKGYQVGRKRTHDVISLL